MKKKIIIKESELKKFVKKFINEQPKSVEQDSLSDMLEEKYQEIVVEVKSALESGDIKKMNEIYDTKIFELNKNLHKVNNLEIVNKFAELEDSLIDYIELEKEYSSIKAEFDKSAEDLKSLL